jgi:fatty-acyl-CoA synthase
VQDERPSLGGEVHRGATYADLLQAAYRRQPSAGTSPGQLQQALAARGVGRGTGVGALAFGREDGAAAIAAAIAAGARLTVLHPLMAVEEQAAQLTDASIDTLLFDPLLFGERAAELIALVPSIERALSLGPAPVGTDILALGAAAPATDLRVAVDEKDIAFVQYTSGTTGPPKGVIVTHRCMAHGVLTLMAELQWPQRVRLLGCVPMTQVLLLPARLRGGTAKAIGFDPELLIRIVEREQITALCLSPPMVCDLVERVQQQPANLSSLEAIFYAGTTIAPARLAEAVEVLGPILCQVYTSTEATHAVTVLQPHEHIVGDCDRLASCGRPVVGIDVAIRDDAGCDLEPGEPGEICVRGRSVADGYWQRPDATREAFRDGWYHTGDLGRRDESGFLTVLGRKAHRYERDGRTVYARCIEDELASDPSVARAVAVAVDGRLEAAIAVRGASPPCRDRLLRQVAAGCGEHAVPSRIHVVDEIPLQLSGKPDRRLVANRISRDSWK